MLKTFLELSMLTGIGLMFGGLIALMDKHTPQFEHQKPTVEPCKHKEYTSSGVIYDDNHKIVQYLRLCTTCGEEFTFTPMCRLPKHKKVSNKSK